MQSYVSRTSVAFCNFNVISFYDKIRLSSIFSLMWEFTKQYRSTTVVDDENTNLDRLNDILASMQVIVNCAASSELQSRRSTLNDFDVIVVTVMFTSL